MSDPSSPDPDPDPNEEPVLGVPPTLPPDIWGELLDRTFAADPDEADDSLVPEDVPGDDAVDLLDSGDDGWTDDGIVGHGDAGYGDEHDDGQLDLADPGDFHHHLPDLPGPV